MEMNFEEENSKNTQSRFLTKKVNEEKKLTKRERISICSLAKRLCSIE